MWNFIRKPNPRPCGNRCSSARCQRTTATKLDKYCDRCQKLKIKVGF